MIFLDLAFGSHLCVVGGKESRTVGTREGEGGLEDDALTGLQILSDQLCNPYSTKGKIKPTTFRSHLCSVGGNEGRAAG